MVEINMDWNIICRICLQDGDMMSLYARDADSSLNFSEKITQCTNIEVRQDTNLPDQICSNCILDLEAAYRFRMNCESSDAILQSYLETIKNEESIEIEENYKLQMNDDMIIIKTENEEDYSDNINYIDSNIIDYREETDESNEEFLISNVKSEEYIVDESEELLVDDSENMVNDTIMKPATPKIRTVKTIKKSMKEPKPTIDTILTKDAPDGTSETVIRMKRNLKSPKPLIICDICGNTYRYKHALETHMRRHRGEKPFSCEECGRSFVVLFELKRHYRTHTGQKPYACKYCERKFSDFGSRIKHERTHTGERPYICATCGKGFAYSHVLSSHVLTHTGEKRYVCTECGKKFTKSHHLKAHMNTHWKTTTRKTNASTSTATKVNNNTKNNNNFVAVSTLKQSDSLSLLNDQDCTYELIELKDGDEQLLNAVAVLTQSQHNDEIQITEELDVTNDEDNHNGIIDDYDDGPSIEIHMSD